MKLILKILLTAIAVVILAEFLPGVAIANYASAIVVAIVLGLLRVTVTSTHIFYTTSNYCNFRTVFTSN